MLKTVKGNHAGDLVGGTTVLATLDLFVYINIKAGIKLANAWKKRANLNLNWNLLLAKKKNQHLPPNAAKVQDRYPVIPVKFVLIKKTFVMADFNAMTDQMKKTAIQMILALILLV